MDPAAEHARGLAVTWLGHATTLIEVDGVRLLTDPLLRNRFFHVRRRTAPIPAGDVGRVDGVLISHLHPDHFDLPSLRALGPQTPIVVPAGAGRAAIRAGLAAVEELPVGRTLDLLGVPITAVHADHSGFRPPFGPHAAAIGYLVGRSRAIYFAGDTGLFAGMGELRGSVDVALLPVGGWGPTLRGGHLGPGEAARAVAMIAPRLALPIHWGTFWPIGLPLLPRFGEPGPRFMDAMQRVPETASRLWRPGDRVQL